MSKRIPSKAQAMFLAAAWGRDRFVNVNTGGGYNDSTIRACVQRGWLVPSEKGGNFPNGEPFVMHYVGYAGMQALADYLARELTAHARSAA